VLDVFVITVCPSLSRIIFTGEIKRPPEMRYGRPVYNDMILAT
jgi:hypothetical protein